MTEQELAEIEARANAATPGEWVADAEFGWIFVGRGVGNRPIVCKFDDEYCLPNEGNLRFVAQAHQDVPALIAEVRRLRALVHQYEMFGVEVVKLVAAIEENRRTLQWKNHDEDVIMLSDSTNNDWARISRTAWGWRMFVFEMPIGMNRSKLDAMCRVGEIMRTMGILRPFDVVKGIGE